MEWLALGPGGAKNMDLKIPRSAVLTTPLPSRSASGFAVKKTDLNTPRSTKFTMQLLSRSASQ